MNRWLFSAAAVMGQSHAATATPCQDKFQIQTSADDNWMAVAVCDGAGSAEFAEIGATITSSYFCQELIKLSNEFNSRPPGEWINDFVIDCVIRVREQLRKSAQSDDIRKYHCTLVAALIGKSGGFSIHIGDGAILGGNFSKPSLTGTVELNTNLVISMPENGEYSNETFFITEGNWVKHLRITPLPAVDWLIACTDGGASLVLDNNNQVKPNFLAPFIESQINARFVDKEYVKNILEDPKANKLTTDDKTLVLAVRDAVLSVPTSLKFTLVPEHTKDQAPTQIPFVSAKTFNEQSSPLVKNTSAWTAGKGHNTCIQQPRKNSLFPTKSLKKSTFAVSMIAFITILVFFVAGLYAYKIWPASLGNPKTLHLEKVVKPPSDDAKPLASNPQLDASSAINQD